MLERELCGVRYDLRAEIVDGALKNRYSFARCRITDLRSGFADADAQDIGKARGIARACAIANLPECGGGAGEFAIKRAEQRGASWRGELHRWTFAVCRDAAQERCRGGRRHGIAAVSALDEPAADVHRRAIPAIDVEGREANGGAGDIDDGVDCPDFVKMYLIEWHIVDGGFRLAEKLESAEREEARIGGERRFVQDFADGRQVAAVVMRMA
jgi:hypothetical protein